MHEAAGAGRFWSFAAVAIFLAGCSLHEVPPRRVPSEYTLLASDSAIRSEYLRHVRDERDKNVSRGSPWASEPPTDTPAPVGGHDNISFTLGPGSLDPPQQVNATILCHGVAQITQQNDFSGIVSSSKVNVTARVEFVSAGGAQCDLEVNGASVGLPYAHFTYVVS